MNPSIFDELTSEWHDDEHRIKDWFHRQPDTPTTQPGDTITTDQPHQPQEPDMSVPDAVTALKANLETAAAALTTALDEDVPGLQNIGAQIDNSRLIQAAVAADTVVPQAVLDAEAAALEALTAAFTPATAVQPDQSAA